MIEHYLLYTKFHTNLTTSDRDTTYMTEQNLVHTKFHTNLTTNQTDIVYMAFHLLLLLFVCFMKALGNCRQRGMNYRGICVQNWVEERKKASRKNEQRKTGQID